MAHVIAALRGAAFGTVAGQEAGICARAAEHGVFLGLLMLFFCLLTNHLVAAWIRGH